MSNSNPSIAAAIDRAADAIRGADALLITAGAGMGVDSGLPDFRGAEGFWNAYPPYKALGIQFQQLATPNTLYKDPHLYWGFYGHRLNLYRRVRPHDGFGILRRWGDSKPAGYFIYTSNVDGQFQCSGFLESRVIECHGSIHFLQCARECPDEIWSAGDTGVAVDEDTMLAKDPLPICSSCGRPARPNILMFDDMSWVPDRMVEQKKRYDQWIRQVKRDYSHMVVIECGAGTAIPTVQIEGERQVDWLGGTLVRINPTETSVRKNGISIPLSAMEALQLIDEKL